MRTNFKMEDKIISMVRGDTLSFGIQIEDQFEERLNVDYILFTCKKNYSDVDNIFQKSLGDGISHSGEGEYVVRLGPEVTQNMVIGKYFYDLKVGLNEDKFTIIKGILEIEANVG